MAKWRVACGVGAVGLCIIVASYWSAWGTIENFHEGWYKKSLADNLTMALVQYLGLPLGFAFLAAVAIWKPRLGSALFVLAGILVNSVLFGFRNAVGIQLILIPCLLLAALFVFGLVPHRHIAIGIALGLPIAIIIGVGVPLAWKVSHRLSYIPDRPLLWATSSETLVWAPPGPGWSAIGVDYRQALNTCDHLTPDGRSVDAHPQHLWRLPTVGEAVRAMNRGGRVAGCGYSGNLGPQSCKSEPDKEAPMWDPYSPIIYWWTSTDDAIGSNLRVSYSAYVHAVSKRRNGYTGFRAVRVATFRAQTEPS
jgi:hypothetical protein